MMILKSSFKRHACAVLSGLILLPCSMAAAAADLPQDFDPVIPAPAEISWPLWQDFKAVQMQDGRVIDDSDPRMITTSEGQSYAMFFALAANDRPAFDALLNFCESKLKRPDGLYAWLYGRNEQGEDVILDDNDAADSDLFIAYCLLEGGRIWQDETLTRRGMELLQQMRPLLRRVSHLGLVILPGMYGYEDQEKGTLELNPSYYPHFILKRLAQADAHWQETVAGAQRVILRSSPNGAVPDWAVFDQRGHYQIDHSAQGAYNAIRVYLFAGMVDQRDPYYLQLRQHFAPLIQTVRLLKTAPAHVGVNDLSFAAIGPYYLTAAFLPYLRTDKSAALLRTELYRSGMIPKRYYGNVLTLFALGFDEGRWYFDRSGQLMLPRQDP